jgi:hypothetical protein
MMDEDGSCRVPHCTIYLTALSHKERELHGAACLKAWTATQYAESLQVAYLEVHQVEDGHIPCPIDDGVCACSDLFTYDGLAFHLYTRILTRRVMWNKFYCKIQGCDENSERP